MIKLEEKKLYEWLLYETCINKQWKHVYYDDHLIQVCSYQSSIYNFSKFTHENSITITTSIFNSFLCAIKHLAKLFSIFFLKHN